MTPERHIKPPNDALSAAFAGLERAVQSGAVPAAAAAVGTAEGRLLAGYFGAAQVVPEQRPLEEHTRFDLASLTKILSTTMLALLALERGDLFLNQRVAEVLPEFGAAGKEQVTVRHLLTHTSGLPAWRDLYGGSDRSDPAPPDAAADPSTRNTPEQARAAVRSVPLAYPTGTQVVYSDLGFITLGLVLERLSGASLDVLAQRDVFGPLGMADTGYHPDHSARQRCAATEVVGARGGALVGEVHDENAAALGGVSGHAGLFATLDDVERFCRLWLSGGTLDGHRLLSAATIAAATRDQTAHADPQARRGLGWVLQPNGFWPGADLASSAAYSHTGFTGTSMVIDPHYGLYAVLLTNRVHPTRGGGSAERIRALRARYHNTVWAALT